MPNVESVAGDIAGAPGSARFRRRGPVKRTPTYPHGPGVKWPRLYRKFRRKGWTKEKAARVSNEMYNKIKSGRYKRRKPRPPFPGVGGVYPGGNPTALARGIASDMARYGRVNSKTVRVGKRDRSGLTRWFNEDWVDISRPLPEGGFAPCGRPDAGEGAYPKCVPKAVAMRMSQKEIKSAVSRKRRAESTQDRDGQKPINVSTFKKSSNVPVDAALYAKVKAEAKRKFDVYPSAYANGWLVQEYKRRGGRYRVEKHGTANDTPAERLITGHKGRSGKKAAKSLDAFRRAGMEGSNTPERLAEAILENGGITYNPKRNERRSTGWAVAIDKKYESTTPVSEFTDSGADVIRKYVSQHEEMLAKPGVHLGAWEYQGDIYLDLSILTQSVDEAADIGRDYDQIGLFHLSNFSDWVRIDVGGVQRYIPVSSDDADIDYLTDLSPAMITLLETISKKRSGKPVIFIAGSEIDEESIPAIHSEIVSMSIAKSAKKKAPKGYHYMPDGTLMSDDEPHDDEVKKNQPAGGDVHVDRPLGSSKYKDPDGGLTPAGRRKFKREFGNNLKPGVKNYDRASTDDKKRWISWALRFYGRDTYPPLKDDKGRPTRFALTANAWGEPVPSTEEEARKIAEKARRRQKELGMLEKREFDTEERQELAEKGKALPDGSYPIETRQDLRNAMQAIGRSKNRARTIRHIRRRANELGVTDLPRWLSE